MVYVWKWNIDAIDVKFYLWTTPTHYVNTYKWTKSATSHTWKQSGQVIQDTENLDPSQRQNMIQRLRENNRTPEQKISQAW